MILAACLALALPVSRPEPVSRLDPAPLFARIGLVGASITEGFGMKRELGGLADLGDFVAGCLDEPGEVQAYGDVLMFQDPDVKAGKQLARLARFEPTLVLGVDFLFWFSYGAGLSEERRMLLFERGLELLEGVEVPLVVGDVPDMSGALEGVSELTGGAFITRDMVPSAATRAAMNERLAVWAAERAGVLVLPLNELLRGLHAGEELRIGDELLGRAPVRELLQADLLHTTAKGSALLALATMRLLVQEREELEAALLTDDVEAVRARVVAPIEAKKKARAERRRQRDEDEADGDGKGNGNGKGSPEGTRRAA